MCGERSITQKVDLMPSSGDRGLLPRISKVRNLPPWIRFLLFGGANTILTSGVFVLLGLVVRPWLAYSVAFFIGVVFVGTLSSRWVFQGAHAWGRKMSYVGWYLIVFLVGQAAIAVLGPVSLTQLFWTSAVLIVVTVPLNFLGGRFIFRHGRSQI